MEIARGLLLSLTFYDFLRKSKRIFLSGEFRAIPQFL